MCVCLSLHQLLHTLFLLPQKQCHQVFLRCIIELALFKVLAAFADLLCLLHFLAVQLSMDNRGSASGGFSRGIYMQVYQQFLQLDFLVRVVTGHRRLSTTQLSLCVLNLLIWHTCMWSCHTDVFLYPLGSAQCTCFNIHIMLPVMLGSLQICCTYVKV